MTVQLIDAATGHHVWAERYDRKIDDIFALQDEISERIVATVTPELERAERKRSVAKQPNDLHAWDLFLRGMSQLYEFTKEGNERARDLFEQTVALDPTYSRGHTGLAYSHYRDVMFVFTDNDEHSIAKCLEFGATRSGVGRSDAFAHFVLSRGLHHAGLIERALDEAKLAIQLNPNDSGSHASLGAVLISAGQPNEGIAALQRAIQLSPKDTRVHVYLSLQSSGHFVAERYAEAAAMAKEVLTRHPGDATARTAGVQLGKRRPNRGGIHPSCFGATHRFVADRSAWRHQMARQTGPRAPAERPATGGMAGLMWQAEAGISPSN